VYMSAFAAVVAAAAILFRYASGKTV